jgi:hypothetical protein
MCMENRSLHHILDRAHCGGTGTCANGKEQTSCAVCVTRNELSPGFFDSLFLKPKVYTGLLCGTCGGIGKTDTLTHRMNYRTAPLLAIILIGGCFVLIFIVLIRDVHFSEILTFCGTLIGSVVGYYFGGKNESRNN